VSSAGSSTTWQIKLAKLSRQVLRPAPSCESWGGLKILSAEITHGGSRSSGHRKRQCYSLLSPPDGRTKCGWTRSRGGRAEAEVSPKPRGWPAFAGNPPHALGGEWGSCGDCCPLQRGKLRHRAKDKELTMLAVHIRSPGTGFQGHWPLGHCKFHYD